MKKETKLDKFLTFGTGYRFPYSIKEFFDPFRYYRMIKKFVQRGTRGWADEDTWNFDYYLSRVVGEGLQHIKKYCHGRPIWVEVELGYTDKDGITRIKEDPEEYCQKWWEDKLQHWSDLFKKYSIFWDEYEHNEFLKIAPDYWDKLLEECDWFDSKKKEPFIYEKEREEVYQRLLKEYDELKTEMFEAFKYIESWWN